MLPSNLLLVAFIVVYLGPGGEAFESLPSEFEWKKCSSSSSSIYDQGPSCQSCCAFAVASALSLRGCSGGVSPKQIWNCLSPSVATCALGTRLEAMEYQMSEGVNASYFLLPGNCTDAVITQDPDQRQCVSTFERCVTSRGLFMPRIQATTTFVLNAFSGPKEYGVILAAKYMMSEIMTNGPVVAVLSLSALEDVARFTLLQPGVIFQPSSDANSTVLFRHCLAVYGWGQDSSTGAHFWKVQNSYGPTWGDQGKARIAKGTLEHEWRSFFVSQAAEKQQQPPPQQQQLSYFSYYSTATTTTANNNYDMSIISILSVTTVCSALIICAVCTLVVPPPSKKRRFRDDQAPHTTLRPSAIIVYPSLPL